VPEHDHRQVVAESADRMVGPLIRILASVGLSETAFLAICASHFAEIRRSPLRRRLRVVVRDPRHADILTRWATHPRYLKAGVPARLKLAGRAPSFASLIRDVDGSLSPCLILKDWCQSKIARRVGGNHVEPLVRFIPTKSGREFDLAFLATMTSDFLRAHEFNILHGTRLGRGLFQRLAYSYDVHPKLAVGFNTFARAQAALLLESIDDWLARHQMPRQRRKRPARLGLGIYVVNETLGASRGKSDR
jgi:hypothetical protein